MTQQFANRAHDPEELAVQFLNEVLAVVGPFEIYGEAHEALWDGYFAELKNHQQRGDFGVAIIGRRLPRPKPLPLLVEPSILYGFFRLWLRKQGIDPDTISDPDWEVSLSARGDEDATAYAED